MERDYLVHDLKTTQEAGRRSSSDRASCPLKPRGNTGVEASTSSSVFTSPLCISSSIQPPPRNASDRRAERGSRAAMGRDCQ